MTTTNGMEKTNEAIRIACENGYKWKIDVTLESMLLDPIFWQALMKGLGKEKQTVVRRAKVWGNFAIPSEAVMFKEVDFQMDYLHEWHFQMHLFIDHLAEGKSIESFFTNPIV